VFNLYVIEGYKHKEIADKLEIDVNTSKSQLSRAKKLLQKKLNDLAVIRIPQERT
jgi:RNA polymerase sigma-70 factor (ECF subfamily)